MGKAELVKAVVAATGLTAVKAEEAVDAVFGGIRQAVEAGKRVELRGFGSFYRKEMAARTGRNPATGEAIQIAAKSVIGFKSRNEL